MLILTSQFVDSGQRLEGIACSHHMHRASFVICAVLFGCIVAGCGGSSGAPSPPTGPVQPPNSPPPTNPSPSPPTSIDNITLAIVSASPDPGSGLARASAQHFTARLRYDAAGSTATPVFVVAHLTQWNGGVIVDNPGDFHFSTPVRSGEIETTIDRRTLESLGVLWIGWQFVLQRPDGTLFAGASFTSTFPIQ